VSYGAGPDGFHQSGGPTARYDSSNKTFYWSWGTTTTSNVIGLQSALAAAGSGLTVNGFTYSYEARNLNYDDRQGSTDSLAVTIYTYHPNGSVRRTDQWVHNTKFDWTQFGGTVSYLSPGPLANFGNISWTMSSRDTGFWAGYYGPQVRNVDLRINYSLAGGGSGGGVTAPASCAGNSLSSSLCPGYVAALANTGPALSNSTASVSHNADGSQNLQITESEDGPSTKSNTRALSIARDLQNNSATAVRAAVSQSQSSASDNGQDSALLTRLSTGTDQDPNLAGFTRPGDPGAAARTMSAAVSSESDRAVTGPSVKQRVEPPAELAGGANFGMLSQGPDLSVYQFAMQDGNMYAPREIYRGQRTVDNARSQRFLNASNEVRHQMMIEQQYNLGK